MILIDAVYIHEAGGKTLLNYLIEKLCDQENEKVFLLLDDRLEGLKKPPFKYLKIKPSEKARFYFYKKRAIEFSKIFCLSNVPPPIKTSIKTYIYFHNELLIDSNNSNFNLINKLKFLIKRFYIKLKNNKNYIWLVQTKILRRKLSKVLKKNKIIIAPFYFDYFQNLNLKKRTNSYIYVSGFNPHKNHFRLIKSFITASKKVNKNLSLTLTLNDTDFNSLMNSFKNIPNNLDIKNLGVLNFHQINEAYEKHEFLIYPSLKESFGLPLIEASIKNLYVLASNLEYVDNVIAPSMKFNPLDINEISNTIINSLNLKDIQKPVVLVENRINLIIKLLFDV